MTEIVQEKKTKQQVVEDQEKAKKLKWARNIGMGTGLGISLLGMYLHNK